MYLVSVDNQISDEIKKGSISSTNGEQLMENVQPSSLDIPIGKECYMVKRSFRSFIKPTEHILKIFAFERIEIGDEPTTLYKGQTYLFPVLELKFPKELSAQFSPKSSIGRVDLLVRALPDRVGMYDWTPFGYQGKVWLEVTPQSFNVKVKRGITLTQLLLVSHQSSEISISDDPDLEKYIKADNLYDSQTAILGLNVPESSKDIAGYEAINTNEPIDLSKKSEYSFENFFKPIYRQSGTYSKIELSKDRFYILATKGSIAVPPRYSAEMLPFNHHIDDIRVHYAGYFDPGFGFGKEGEVDGNSGVLEVRPFSTVTLYDSQPIVLFRYYLNDGSCTKVYGYSGNNYANQSGVRLAKYFK